MRTRLRDPRFALGELQDAGAAPGALLGSALSRAAFGAVRERQAAEQAAATRAASTRRRPRCRTRSSNALMRRPAAPLVRG